MLNLDPIQKMLRQYTGMSVHGITDSGWFMDHHQPFHQFSGDVADRPDPSGSPIEAVKRGIPYWHSQIPSRCRNLYVHEPSMCFIGYKIYPTLTGKYRRLSISRPFYGSVDNIGNPTRPRKYRVESEPKKQRKRVCFYSRPSVSLRYIIIYIYIIRPVRRARPRLWGKFFLYVRSIRICRGLLRRVR